MDSQCLAKMFIRLFSSNRGNLEDKQRVKISFCLVVKCTLWIETIQWKVPASMSGRVVVIVTAILQCFFKMEDSKNCTKAMK